MKKKHGFKSWGIMLLGLLLMLAMLGGCAQQTKQTYKSGTYTAQAEGHGGSVKLEVTFDSSKITDIKVVQQTETAGLGDTALEKIRTEILSNQSLDVDTVSGATYSSRAILAAVEDAVKQAGGNVDTLKSKNTKTGEGKVEKLTTDIAVVGAGASGVTASVSAADKGAKVILIEKTATIGGASNLSWAARFFNSSVALQNNVKVDLEKKISDWISLNHWKVNAADVRQYITKSGATYDWLTKKGYITTFLNFNGDQMHVLPAYDTRQATLKKMLADSVEKQGGQVLTEITAQKLMTDKNGAVTGVVAQKADGTTLEITAKAVIMATGGYAGNAEIVKEKSGFEGPLGGLGQNVGEGLKMAWAAGARVPNNLGIQMVHQTLAKATASLKKQYTPFQASYPLILTYQPTLMNVGPNGARFRDEATTLVPDQAAITSTYNVPYHLVIVSKSQVDALMSKGLNGIKAPGLPAMPPEFYADFKDQFTLDNPWKDADKVLDAMVKNGDGYKGDTIEELAKNAGFDVDTFTKAFNNYETATKSGVDAEFGKDSKYLLSMGSGPYYAIVAQVNNLGSVGGLDVNEDFQVLNSKRLPIKGLYSVGLDSEGVMFSDAYLGNGDGVGYAFTSGLLGGEAAATKVLGK